MPDAVSLVVQAGGKSRRMGEDKGLKLFLGRPLIQRVLERLVPVADEILVTTNHPEDYVFLGYRLVPDLIPGTGALGGIYTALASASCPITAVVACDMPFVSATLFDMAIDIMRREAVDVVVPRSKDGLEPLHAVYRQAACLPVIRTAIAEHKLKIIDWFPAVRVHELDMCKVSMADPSGLVFRNINTPEEFAEAEKIVRLGWDH